MRTLPHRTMEQDHKTMFVTPHHDNIKSFCGHMIDVQREPRTNCEQCWAFYFMQNHEFTKSVAERYMTGENGKQGLVNQFGSKFVTRLQTFMYTVAKAREVQAEINKQMIADKEYDIVLSPDAIEGGVFDGETEAAAE